MIKHRIKVHGSNGWIILRDNRQLIGYCWFDKIQQAYRDKPWNWETIGVYPMNGVEQTLKEAIEQMSISSSN